jgi:hypothetical protein
MDPGGNLLQLDTLLVMYVALICLSTPLDKVLKA